MGPDTGKYVTLALLYVSIGRPQDVFPILKYAHVGMLLGGLVLVCIALAPTGARNSGVWKFAENKLVAALFGLVIVNGLFSEFKGHGLEYLEDWLKVLVLYLGMVCFLNGEKDFRRVAAAMMLSGITLSSEFVLQGVIGSRRMQLGTYYDPNDLAMVLVACLPFAWYFLQGGSKIEKVLGGIGMAGAIPGVIATQSRMGFLALVLIGIWYTFRAASEKGSLFKRVSVLCLMIVLFSSVAGPQYWSRVETIFDEDQTGSGRTVIWKRALKMAAENPLLGVGPGAFASSYGRKLRAGEFELVGDAHVDLGWKTAHNTYVLVLVELGVPGLMVFVGLIGTVIRNIFRAGKKSNARRSEASTLIMARALEMSFVAYMFCAFFLSLVGSAVFYTLVATGILVQNISQMAVQDHQDKDCPRSVRCPA